MHSILGTIIITISLIGFISLSLILFGRLTTRDLSALVQPHQTIEVDGRTRKYRYYSPQPNQPLPLVVVLHGYNYDSGRISELYTGWSNLADQTGEFAVAYPEGVGRSWNGGFCCGLAYARGVDDVRFIEQMLDQIKSQQTVKINQVYVVGFSNGSFLAQRLLSTTPERFAAGAAVMTGIGEDDGRQLDISGASSPLVLVTGSQDPYTNHQLPKSGFRFSEASQTDQAWAEQLAVSPQSTTTDGFEETIYTDQSGQTKLISRVYDESHRWPGWRLWSFTEPVSPFTSDLWQQLKQLSDS